MVGISVFPNAGCGNLQEQLWRLIPKPSEGAGVCFRKKCDRHYLRTPIPALPCATYNPCVSEINWNKWESRTMSVAPCLSENLSPTAVNENKHKSSKRWFHRSKYSCAQALNTQVVNLVHFFSHITDLSLRYVDCKIGFLHTYTLQVGDQSRGWTGEPKKNSRSKLVRLRLRQKKTYVSYESNPPRYLVHCGFREMSLRVLPAKARGIQGDWLLRVVWPGAYQAHPESPSRIEHLLKMLPNSCESPTNNI